jgi:hypothetical protein
MQKTYLFSMQSGMPQANALKSIGYTDTIVREHPDRVHNVILIECIFGSGKPLGVGILGKGSTWTIGGTKGSVYEQQGAEVDGSCHSKEGSK